MTVKKERVVSFNIDKLEKLVDYHELKERLELLAIDITNGKDEDGKHMSGIITFEMKEIKGTVIRDVSP